MNEEAKEEATARREVEIQRRKEAADREKAREIEEASTRIENSYEFENEAIKNTLIEFLGSYPFSGFPTVEVKNNDTQEWKPAAIDVIEIVASAFDVHVSVAQRWLVTIDFRKV